MSFQPNLTIFPPAQLSLWPELASTPQYFTLYGGTAIALRLGHRTSVDFDFFTNDALLPDELLRSVAYLKEAETVQADPNTLTCRVDRGGPVLVSFFGGLSLGTVGKRDQAEGNNIYVASLLDLAATKMDIVQKRAEEKDFLDIDALLRHGLKLVDALKAAETVYGKKFNPLITLKALSYFGDVPSLPLDVQQRLLAAVKTVSLEELGS